VLPHLQYWKKRTTLHSTVELPYERLIGDQEDQLVEWVLAHPGVDALAADQDGATPLHLAAATGRHGALSVLLNHLVKLVQTKAAFKHILDVGDALGRSPLAYAAAFNKHQTFSLLLEYGASIIAVDHQGWSVAHHAARSAAIDILEIISQRSPALLQFETAKLRVTPCHLATRLLQHHEGVLWFLEHHADLATKLDLNHRTVLHYASASGAAVPVKMLLGTFPQLLAARDRPYQRLALHYAALNGRLECLEECLGAGSDPNDADAHGRTALHFAASKGRHRLVEALIQAKATVNLLDREGVSALHLAVAAQSYVLRHVCICC